MTTSKQIESAAESVFESLPQAYVSGMLTHDQYKRAHDTAMVKLSKLIGTAQMQRVRDGIHWAFGGFHVEPSWFV